MGKRNFLVLTAVVVLALCTASPASPNLIVNGSFEADSFTGSGLGYRLGLVGSAVTGWFIPTSDGVYPWGLQNVNAFGAGPTPYGNQWLVLGETGAGGPTMVDRTIQQTMTGLTPGATYNLSFAIASELDSSSAVVEVSFLSGSSTGAQDFSAPVRAFTFWDTWGTDSMNFVATSSSVTLQFKDLAVEFPTGGDLGLDNVVVTGSTIPEPGSMILLGSGILGLAGTLRRRLML